VRTVFEKPADILRQLKLHGGRSLNMLNERAEQRVPVPG
jgi:hypothetical protein